MRRRAESIWRKSNDIDNRIAYKDLCSATTLLARSKKKAYFTQLLEKSNNNPKTLYNLVNTELDRKQSKPLPEFTGNFEELASSFNNFFSEKIKTIRANMNHEPVPEFISFPGSQILSEFEPATENELRAIIKESAIKTSPDDILPCKLIKQNIDVMLPLIVKLVNISLSQGSMEGLKSADIIPL
ncbi:MAG: hypothetical protein GY816_07300, partial [Cytophagales bacterium]|nr:hypothetical protein [Cytophagales bacterium]